MSDLQRSIEQAFDKPASELGEEARQLYAQLVALLRRGEVRAAEPQGDGWVVNTWVKKGILVGMRAGVLVEIPSSIPVQPYIEKNTMLPRPLSLAQLDLTVASGQTALSAGDGRGARALADVGEKAVNFAAAGGAAGGSMAVSRYLSDLAGDIGGRAASAEQRHSAASSLVTEARSRRSSYEGVNLDEELVKLTTFQQAFNASARMIQAAKDMYDILLGMT